MQLAKNGFSAIDAIDGSEAMLTKLRQKGIYRRATQVNTELISGMRKKRSNRR